MEGHCSTDQNPQWAVVPMEEEEEEKEDEEEEEEVGFIIRIYHGARSLEGQNL